MHCDLKVSQASLDKKLKSYFFRMPRAQAGHHTQKIFIRVGSRNPVSEEELKIKLRSSGIWPLNGMEVEGIPFGLRFTGTNKFFKPLPMTDDEVLRIPVSSLEAALQREDERNV